MGRVKVEIQTPPTVDVPAQDLVLRLEHEWGSPPNNPEEVLRILAEALGGTPVITLHDCYRWDIQVPGLGQRFLGYESSGLSHCIPTSLPQAGATIQHEGKTFFIASHREASASR